MAIVKNLIPLSKRIMRPQKVIALIFMLLPIEKIGMNQKMVRIRQMATNDYMHTLSVKAMNLLKQSKRNDVLQDLRY